MTKKQAKTLSILMIAALVLTLMVTSRFWFRLDFTKNKAYTISKVSRNLYTEIPDQVRIVYYLSSKLKAVHPLPGEIEDLLHEYAAHSHGKIQVVIRDPIKAGLSEQVERMGIQAQQIRTYDQGENSLITVYTGLTIEYLDKIEVLPVVFSLATLEYDLTTRIRSMVRGTERQLGVIVGDDPRRWNEEYGYLNNAFSQAGYRIRVLQPGADIADTLPMIFVLGGEETLNDAALYQIDRYIQNGGRVLFAVNGVFVDTAYSLQARLMQDGGLLAMLGSYGVIVRPEIAMDRSALTMQYQTQMPNGAVQFRIVRNAQWIRVLPENGNPDHPVSSRFEGLDLYWASPLELNPPRGVNAEPLFTSTDEAWAMLGDVFYTDPSVSYLFEKDAAQTKGKKILGASLSGIFPSWFEGHGKPYSESGEELPDMPVAAKLARVIVIGDSDFAGSAIGATGARHNLDFLLYAADWLGNDDDIIGIRNRESQAGRLDKILEPEKRAAAMRSAQSINMVLIPLLVVAAGIFVAVRRKKKSREIEEMAKEQTNDV